MNAEACDDLHIDRGKVTHQHTTNGPVHDIHPRHVTGTDGYIEPLVMTSGIESGQVLGIMAEVGIHLEDIVVVSFQCPFETCNIGSPQSQLALTLDDEEPVVEFRRHQSADNGSSSVGRTVVNDKDMETLIQGEYGSDDLRDILLLIVRWDDDYTVALVHLVIFCDAKIRIN